MGQEDTGRGVVTIDYTPAMYKFIKYMWNTHKKEAPPADMFKQGIVCGIGDTPLSAIFIYDTGVSMALIEWMISNAQAGRKNRNEAIDLMLNKAVSFCIEKGYKYIYTATGSPIFQKRLEKAGFKVKVTNQKHMFWGL